MMTNDFKDCIKLARHISLNFYVHFYDLKSSKFKIACVMIEALLLIEKNVYTGVV